MTKKIAMLLTICCLYITYGANFEGQSDRRSSGKTEFIELISKEGTPKKVATVFATWLSAFIDEEICGHQGAVLNPPFSRMLSASAVLFPEAIDGALISKENSKIVANAFCLFAVFAMPEVAIGTYSVAYLVNAISKYCGLDPMNRSVLSYWGGRIGGILSYSLVPAALGYFAASAPAMLNPFSYYSYYFS